MRFKENPICGIRDSPNHRQHRPPFVPAPAPAAWSLWHCSTKRGTSSRMPFTFGSLDPKKTPLPPKCIRSAKRTKNHCFPHLCRLNFPQALASSGRDHVIPMKAPRVNFGAQKHALQSAPLPNGTMGGQGTEQRTSEDHPSLSRTSHSKATVHGALCRAPFLPQPVHKAIWPKRRQRSECQAQAPRGESSRMALRGCPKSQTEGETKGK